MIYVVEVFDERGGWVLERNKYKTESDAKVHCKSIAKKRNKTSRVVGLSNDGPDEIIIAYRGGDGKAIY